jgi:transcriptional/translational regulatory protein YebC/TACO1
LIVEGTTEDALMECALDAGADDIQGDGMQGDGIEGNRGIFQVLCPPAALAAVRSAVAAAGISVESAEIVWVPLQTVEADESTVASVERLVDLLEDHDDVQRVFTNLS